MNKNFAETLKKLRAEKNDATGIAERIFVARSVVAKWENAFNLSDMVMVKRICKVLDVNEYVLIQRLFEDDNELNVIVVDDRQIITRGEVSVIEKVLPNANIFGFTKVSEAFNFATKNKISIAFLDIEIGQINGLDLSQKFLEINPNTNIIFLTAYVKYSFEAWSTGASGYLLKPLTIENLKTQLKNLRYPLPKLEVQNFD